MQKYIDLVETKLEEAKPLIKLFGLDYDGTVSDGVDYKLPEVMVLVERILAKGKSVAFITARAATALKILVPPLQEILMRTGISIPSFVAGGNGTTLYEVKKNKLVEIYNHGLELSQIKHAVDVWKKVYEKFGINTADLNEKGLKTFQNFLQENWDGYIPLEIVDICRPYEGKIFTEKAKVTFVLPKDKSFKEKIVAEVNNKLGEQYQAVAGDDIFVHITKQLEEDSKVVAIKTILESMALKPTEVATFGDMPTDNDAGLLSFPYSFTNSEEFIGVKTDLENPPYILTEPDLGPVARVYKAINYLL